LPNALTYTEPVKVTCATTCSLATFCLWLTPAIAQTTTPRIVAAAKNFLASLDEKQRRDVLFALDDEKQRVRWSNLPVSMAPRAGLKMGDLSANQKTAAMDLLSATLSRRGFYREYV
jgi:hypothetical protein